MAVTRSKRLKSPPKVTQTTQSRVQQSSISTKNCKPVTKRSKSELELKKEATLQKKKAAEASRRQRIKEDPVKYNKHCQKERERSQERRRSGKIKSTNQLNKKEQKFRKNQQNKWKRESRLKAKTSLQEADDKNNNTVSKQARVGRKRIIRNVRKSYRDNKKLVDKNKNLQTTVNKLSKRLERLEARKSTSPKSTVQKFLRRRLVDKDVKDKLISHEVLVQQIKNAYSDSRSNKFKQTLGRVMCGKIVKKYRKLTQVRKDIIPVVSSRLHRSSKSLKCVKQGKGGLNFVKDKVKQFFDDNSQIDPGKRNCKRINGELVSKRHMNASVKDLHLKFCSENSLKVSYAFFAKYRPVYCIAPKITARNTCACFIHENFTLLVNGLYKMKVIEENSTEKLIKQVTCDTRSEQCLSRMCSNCQSKIIEFNIQNVDAKSQICYKKWETSKVQRLNEKTKKPIIVSITQKVDIVSTIKEATEIFQTQFQSLM